MAGYVPPEFKDFDPRHAITADVLRQLADQYPAVARDATDTTTPVGSAIAQAAAAAGGGMGVRDNGDGTLTLINDAAYTDNGDGTLTIGA